MKELNGFMAVFTSHESDVHERWVQGDNHACYGPGGGSMQELKPCPHCGSIDVYVRGRINAQVTCRICGMEGPEPWGNKAAIAAWNNLPRMSTIIAWQFQAAGAVLENQRLKAILQGILDNDGGETGFNAFELDKFRQQARAAIGGV